ITRPIIIFLSAIADLLAPPYSITSSVGAGHESRRAPPALPTEEISHLNVAGDCCAAGFQSSPCPLLVHPVQQCPHARPGFWIVLGQVHQHADPVPPLALLRPRRERPSGCRAAEQRDELAPPPHSITSSARAMQRRLSERSGGKVPARP